MFKTIKSVLSDKKVMKRIGFTFFIIFIFKALTYIAVPFADATVSETIVDSGGTFFAMMDSFSGSALKRFSIAALGISPYITASIVIQMMQMLKLSKKLTALQEMGESGKQRINERTRQLALFMAFVQALAVLTAFSANRTLIVGIEPNAFIFIYMALVMTAGTALVLWLADQITRRGIGNGTSMIIIVGIVGSVPTMYRAIWDQFITNGSGIGDTITFIIICLINFAILLGVIFLQASVRKIPISHSSGGGKGDANIPVKLNTAGVIPVIFASTIASLVMFLISSTGMNTNVGIGGILNSLFNYQEPLGMIIYSILIVIFSFFYAFLMLSPEKIADNLEKSRAFIPGVRPGKETETFLTQVIYKITLVGSTYLVILAILPIILVAAFGLDQSASVGGTSLLIIVGVAIETTKQVEATQTEKSYEGFIK